MGKTEAINRSSLEKSPETVADKSQSDESQPPETKADVTQPGTATGGDDWEYVTGYKLWMILSAVTLASFTMLLDTSIIVTAIPRITSDFHSLGDVGWYGSAYLLSSCALQPMTGKLYNQFSSKYTFLVFIGLFELGSLICGLAKSSDMLIVGRAVAGMGASGLMNGGLTILSACVPLQKRATYLGFLISFAQLGILFGPLLGGALTQYVTWRWCFYINLPIGGIVVAIVLLSHVPDRTGKSAIKGNALSILHSLDLPGFGLFAPTTIMFLLALEWGGTKYAWNSSTVIGLFCGSAGNLVVFLVWEWKRGDSAMIPISMIKQRIVWSACLTMIFFFGCLMCTTYYLSIYFQAVKGVEPTLSGVYLLPSILSQMMFAIISGVGVGRLGYYLPWSVGSSILTSIGAGLMSTFLPSTSVGKWIGFQILAGVGRGCGMQMPIVAIQNCLPPETTSVSMSLVVFSQSFGGALFLAFAQTAFSNGLKDALPKFAPNVSAQAVIAAGATSIREVVSKADLDGVLLAYSHALSHVFYLAMGAAIGCFIFCWGMGWKSVKKAKAEKSEA